MDEPQLTLSNGQAVSPSSIDPNPIDPGAYKVMKTIKQMEGGDYENRTGDSGSSAGAYQWNNDNIPLKEGELPTHWKAAAQKYLGDENAPMTKFNQDFIAYQQVKAYKDEGYSPTEIDALWNGAHKDPNTGQYVHNSAARGEKFQAALQKEVTPPGFNPHPFSQPGGAGAGAFDYSGTPPTADNANKDPGFFQGLMQDMSGTNPQNIGTQIENTVKGAGSFLFPVVGDAYHDIKGDSTKSGLQQFGDAALSALPFIPGLGEVGEAARGAEAAGEGAGLIGKLAANQAVRGAGVGYGAGVASNLSRGQSIGQAVSPNMNTILGAATGGIAPALVKGAGALATKASGIDPQIENELARMGSTPNAEDTALYDKYINATKVHATNVRAPAPLNMAADELDNAAAKIEKSTEDAGAAVGEAKRVGANIPLQTQEMAPVVDNFRSQLADRYGLTVNDTGNLMPIAGSMRQIAPSELSRLQNVYKQLLTLQGGDTTVRHASDVIANLNDLIDHTKDDVYGKSHDPIEGLLMKTAGDINEVTRKSSPQLAAANDRFSQLKGLQHEISSMAGKNLQRGELLIRRVFSGDQSAGVQDLFGKIKNETGIDLVKHAILARHAIQSFGSSADKTLLQQAIEGGVAAHTGGIIPGVMKLAGGAARATIANPQKIGRKLIQGKKGGALSSLMTKTAIEASRIPGAVAH